MAFALCAALCWGLYIILGKRTGHMPGGQTVALGMVTAAVLVVPIGIATAGTLLLTPALAAIGFTVAILSSAVPYLLDMHALKRIPAYRYGVMMSVDPAIAAIVGRLFLGERISTQQCIAIGLIVAASIGSVIAAAGTGEKLAERSV